jgi:hypothetical protein
MVAACSHDLTPPPGPPPAPATELGCTSVTDVALAPGESIVLSEAASSGCIRIPAGASSREYLAVAYSASSQTDPGGISGLYRWRARSAVATPSPAPAWASEPPDLVAEFHALLRERDRAGARRQSRSLPLASPGLTPVPGDRRSFGVCSDPGCFSFVAVPATAAYVGRRMALFIDDSLPSGGFSAEDYQRFGRLFDDQLYPIDTTAFGRESDIDGNGVVLVVITRQVNRLCPALGGVVSGYFYGLDLRPAEPGSNGGEVFYAVAPDPQGENGCHITRDFVERVLPGTLAHEFQHMISYNQHVLIRHGAVEDNWLNEGLSHLAEEIAGRRVPSSNCIADDCLSQFAFTDVSNAYQYLSDPERWFAVYPSTSTGRSAERGAAWLLVRWVIDQYGGSDAFTRSLVATGRLGGANLAAVTGIPFETLLGEWHLANFLDDLPGYSPANSHLQYKTWNWRVTFPSLRAQFPGQYPRSFPLVPDSTVDAYDREGTLRGGSGRYLRLTFAAGAEPIDLRLTDPTGSGPVAPEVEARIAVARIR